ncbi:MAG: FKBP-type peptidyl-prolyl cis-trans isomerase N-terminal domain-containing protein, partial [Alistipes sp.]|nr:FKBP-type peptidyl-prolyl cis-trans isomerase N-terminal domain-containing protein [Alistipes sp.]
MKKTFMAVVALACAALVVSCGNKAALQGDRATFDTLSYAFGANSGYGIKVRFADLNLDVVSDAAVDALVGKASQTQEEAQEILREFFGKTMRDRHMAHQEVLKTDSTAVFKLFESNKECKKISRALGIDFGSSILKANDLDIQYYWFIKGFDEACNDKAELTEEQAFEFLNRY